MSKYAALVIVIILLSLAYIGYNKYVSYRTMSHLPQTVRDIISNSKSKSQTIEAKRCSKNNEIIYIANGDHRTTYFRENGDLIITQYHDDTSRPTAVIKKEEYNCITIVSYSPMN